MNNFSISYSLSCIQCIDALCWFSLIYVFILIGVFKIIHVYIALFIIFSHWCTQHTIDVCACVWMWLPLEKRCSSKQMRAKRLSSNQDILFGGCFWMALWRLVFVALVVCVDFFELNPCITNTHQQPITASQHDRFKSHKCYYYFQHAKKKGKEEEEEEEQEENPSNMWLNDRPSPPSSLFKFNPCVTRQHPSTSHGNITMRLLPMRV